MKMPQELFIETSPPPKKAFVGGVEDVTLTLEYMKTGTDPQVTITVTYADGTTNEQEITNISNGYHVKDDFATVPPGSKIEIEVNNCTARLRWCEIISC